MKTVTASLVLFVAGAPAPAALAQSPSTLDKIKASGTITLAYRESSIPFSYLGNDAQPTGFGWEVCGKVVEQVKRVTGRADLKVATQSVTSQNRIPLMVNGTIDIECGSTTNNSDHAKQVAFAINYFYTGTRFLVKADSSIKTVADLKGKKVVSTTGTTNFQVLRKLNADKGLDFD
jgi:glutamate/aspartate transport system substrate-binding protein